MQIVKRPLTSLDTTDTSLHSLVESVSASVLGLPQMSVQMLPERHPAKRGQDES